MGLLILLLVGEQVLAYFNSFHAHRGTQLDHLGRPGHRASIQRLREQNEADARAELAQHRDDHLTADRKPAASGPSHTDMFARGVPR
jgi:hypothetical protein